MDTQNVNNLISRSLQGDKSAYAKLIRQYYDRVFAVCMGLLGNSHDAEDAAQEAMLKGFLKLRTLRRPELFGSWICKIAKNECRNVSRKKMRAGNTQEYDESIHAKPETPKPEHAVLHGEIEKLPSDLREPLMLYYFEGKKVRSVAEHLGMSPSNVYHLLRTATRRLQSVLSQEGGTL